MTGRYDDPALGAHRLAAPGIGIWKWLGTEASGVEPDVVMACAGDVPTLQTLASVDLAREALQI